MSALILPSRRVVQPQGPVEVDWGNPLARGLVAALVPDGAGYIDYVNRTQYPATSASIRGSGPGKIVALGGTGYTDLGVQSIGGVSLFASAVSGSFTVITFAKLATAGAVGTFLAKSGSSDSSKTLQIFNSGTTTQTPSIVIRGRVNTTSWGFSDTAFHQYAITFDAETASAVAYGDADKSLSLILNAATEEAENIVIGARTGGSGARLTGQTSYTYFFNRALSQSEIAEIYRNPWQLFRPIQRRIWVPVAGGGATNYSLTADVGAYSLAGIDATLTYTAAPVNYSLTADVGSYALTGVNATLTYTVAGTAYTLSADAGSYSLTGVDATLAYVPGGGAYTLTAETGSYSLTGNDAGLTFARSMTADVGSYTLNGVAAGLQLGRRLTGDTGAYALAGVDAVLTYTSTAPIAYSLVCEPGAYLLSGADAALSLNGELEGGGAGFVFTDTPSALWWKRKPKALSDEVAEQNVKRVVRVIKEIAAKQAPEQSSKQAKREVAQAIAPMLVDMPGFDWMPIYRNIVADFERQREDAARIEAVAQIARIRAIEQDDEDVMILLMSF